MVLRVIEAGYEDNLLLSSDFANTRQIKANWGNGFSTVLVQFVPKLRYAGVPEETIHRSGHAPLRSHGRGPDDVDQTLDVSGSHGGDAGSAV